MVGKKCGNHNKMPEFESVKFENLRLIQKKENKIDLLTWQHVANGIISQSVDKHLQNTFSSLLVLQDNILQPTQQIIFSQTLPKQSGISAYILQTQQHRAKQGTKSYTLTSPVLTFSSSPVSLIGIIFKS